MLHEHVIIFDNEPSAIVQRADGRRQMVIRSEQPLQVESLPNHLPGVACERVNGFRYIRRHDLKAKLFPFDWVLVDILNRQGSITIQRLETEMSRRTRRKYEPNEQTEKNACGRINEALAKLGVAERISRAGDKIVINAKKIA